MPARPGRVPLLTALVVMCLVTTGLVGCALPGGGPAEPDTVVVRIGGVERRLLLAPPDGDGMRGRTDFGPADGMLFDLGGEVDPGTVGFVMDGVEVRLDIAWFDVRGGFIGSASMVPCRVAPCPLYRAEAPFRWAVEAAPGAFDGLDAGTRLELPGGGSG